MREIQILISSLLFLAGCGHSESSDHGFGPLHETITGSVVEAVADIQGGKYAEDCDRKFSGLQNEIATQLDARAQDIVRVANTDVPPERKINVGPTFMTKTSVAPGADRWVSSSNSWQHIFAHYQAIKSTPTNADWVSLNRSVRRILVDDRARAVNGVDTGLDHAAAPRLQALRELLEGCTRGCILPQLPSDLQDFVQRNLRLRGAWYRATHESDAEKKQKALASMLTCVKTDLKRYQFHVNSTVKLSEAELQLMLASVPFQGSETQLNSFIEDIWQNSHIKVRVKWQPETISGIFHLLLDLTQPYSRAFVNWNKQIVQLYPGVNTRAVAHEIGHVLGFTDHYYTLWDHVACSYTIEENQGDLMSSHLGGQVTSADWQELLRHYR